jgi:tetratricopeptide (TPR) repeat protein
MALHGQIADALLEQHGEAALHVAAQLAAHFKAARRFEPAIRFLMAAGDNAARLHANRESGQYYADALALVAELGPADRTAPYIILHYNQGWMHWNVGAHAKALGSFEAMLESARATAFTSNTAEAQRARDVVFAYFEQPWRDGFGSSELARMPNQDRSLGPSAIQAEAYWGISFILSSMGRWEELGVRTTEFLRLAQTSHNEPRRVEALVWIGKRELGLGHTSEAARILDEALPAARKLGHTRALFSGLHVRGLVHYLSSEDEASEELFAEALPLAIEAAGRIWSLSGMARARASSGRVFPALSAFDEALDVCRRIEDERTRQMLHNEIGDLFLELGLPARALVEHARALEIASRHALRTGQIHALIGLGRGHRASFDTERAHAELERAEQLLHEPRLAGEPQLLTHRYSQNLLLELDAAWAEYQLEEGRIEVAERHARALLTAASGCGSLRHVVRARHILGCAELLRGELHGAEVQVEAGLGALAGHRHPLLRRKLWTTLGAVRQRAGNRAGAAVARAAAIEIVDELSAAIVDPALRADWLASLAAAELAMHDGPHGAS